MAVALAGPAPVAPARSAPSGGRPDLPDAELVALLRDRDEEAYVALVRRHTPLMLHVARGCVARREVAEDVVQDTWMAVLCNIDRFESRSTFTTWLMRILVNTARTRRLREARTVCWSSMPGEAGVWDVPAGVTVGAGAQPVGPERTALSAEAWSAIRAALDELPERQRTVVVLRDVEGWTSDEVRAALDLSAGNQRVLLHRGRAQLRASLAPYLEQSELAGARHRLGA
jgi:RNA polymerase sigma-70 factor (ECF subfamily)